MTFFIAPPRVYNLREIRFQTFSHPELKFYDSLFYLDYKYKGCSRNKRVAENIH